MATQFSVHDGRKWKASFFSIFIGQALSLLGSELVSFALIWYLTVETGSATVLATVSIVTMLPRAILGPFIGPLVDRWNRKTIMIISDSVIAIATVFLAVFFASGNVGIWQIYLIILIRAIGGAFHGPSMSASTSLMVPTEHLPRVQGVNQMLNGGLSIIAAPIGALLYELIPIHSILAIDVFSAIFAILPLFVFKIPQPEKAVLSANESEEGKSSYRQELLAGFKYVAAWPGLLIVIGMAMLINSVLSPAGALLPLLVKNHFLGGVQELGWINSVFGGGVILGGLMLGVWGGFKNKSLTSMVSMFALGLGFSTLGLLAPNQFRLAYLGAGITSFAMPFLNGSIGAIMQISIAPEMQGRVMTLLGSGATILGPVGLLFAGPIADKFGIQTWFVISGGVCMLLAVIGLFLPQVMSLEKDGIELRKRKNGLDKSSPVPVPMK